MLRSSRLICGCWKTRWRVWVLNYVMSLYIKTGWLEWIEIWDLIHWDVTLQLVENKGVR